MLPAEDLESLAKDIKSNGLQQSIVLYEGKILDGRNRYKACHAAGVEFHTEHYAGDDPVSHVLSLNLHRRHLTPSQLAMVAETVATMRVGDFVRNQHTENRGLSTDKPQPEPDRKTRKQAAKELGVSEPSIDRARVVRKKGIPELIKAVEVGQISVGKAAQIAAMPQDEQAAAMTQKQKPIKSKKEKIEPKPRPIIPTEDDLKREAERVLGNLKAAWVAASTATRTEFLEWIEKNKNKTTA
jgi:ParB-like chromosome segregation protein Spo0J